MTCSAGSAESFILSPVGSSLQWQEWDDVYVVYQPSSAETHVFNESTALILKCLEHGPRSIKGVRDWTEKTLGVVQGDLDADVFEFATMRLEELGLIESLEDVSAAR